MNKATEQRTAALRIPEDLFVIGQPFTRNELGAMTSRGYLRETLPGHYIDTRHRYSPTVRARIAQQVAGRYLQHGEVFTRCTAGWIHGFIANCSTLHISGAHYRRPVAAHVGVNFEFHQQTLEQQEILLRAEVPLSDMLRTLCDMACHDPLPLAVEALNTVIGMEDPYLNLPALRDRLTSDRPSAAVQRGLRLLGSMDEQAA